MTFHMFHYDPFIIIAWPWLLHSVLREVLCMRAAWRKCGSQWCIKMHLKASGFHDSPSYLLTNPLDLMLTTPDNTTINTNRPTYDGKISWDIPLTSGMLLWLRIHPQTNHNTIENREGPLVSQIYCDRVFFAYLCLHDFNILYSHAVLKIIPVFLQGIVMVSESMITNMAAVSHVGTVHRGSIPRLPSFVVGRLCCNP